MPSFLVTGANGFIGRHLVSALRQREFSVKQAVRRNQGLFEPASEVFAVGNIGPATNWDAALDHIDVVVHLAARAHFLEMDSENEYRTVNVLGTERLARRAAEKGVSRFVYVSSAGVNGNQNRLKAFTEDDNPNPHDIYTISKWEAEQKLRTVSFETGLEIVVLRPPLVYGPGNPGNFLRLLRLISAGWPLPFGALENHRSLLFVGNFVHAIIHCAIHPNAAGQTYFVKDEEDISTSKLICNLAELLGRRPRLISFPPSILRCTAKMMGKSADLDRLMASFIIDDSKIRSTLGWKPPYNMMQGLKETVAWYNNPPKSLFRSEIPK